MADLAETPRVRDTHHSLRRPPAFCHLCGAQLGARFFRHSNGLTFCEACSASRPRCPRCSAPLDDLTLAHARLAPARGSALCRRCTRTAPRCAACAQAIVGPWYTFEELMPAPAPRRFCERCVASRPRCDICRVPVATSVAPLDDGQYRCGRCAGEMVLGDSAVAAVYADALRAFVQIAGPLRDRPRFEVVSRLRMGEIRRRYEPVAPAEAQSVADGYHVLGFFVRTQGRSAIYVERALPRGLLLGTFAHELGHAWQATQAPELRDPLLCEGFAEWVAHGVLSASGLRAMADRAAHRDDLYGRGLRHYLQIERHRGRPGVLAVASGL
jgi:hypothetical protein